MSYKRIGPTIFATLAMAAFVWASESDELREKAKAMQRKAAELAERGHGEEAENLERNVLAMLEEAEHLERHRTDQREAGIRKMQEGLKMLRLQESELNKIGGKEERLADVRREADRIERRLHKVFQDERSEKRRPQAEIAGCLEHMRVAVEHLRYAGLHDIAEHVAARAEATERELHEHHWHHDDNPIHAIMTQLNEIQHEVGRLRDEVNELK